ncbi:MAG: glycosyltransferase, partial [Anaerolineae bacterium]
YDVNVLCSQPTYAARGSFAPWREVRNGVRIERCPGTTFDKDVLVPRLVNVITISLSLFLRALSRIRKSDVVIAVTNPPLLPFLVEIACRLRSANYILRIDDVYPEALTATGLARPDSTMVRVLARMTRRLYRSVGQIIVVGRDMERLAREKLGGTAKQISVIPNWADVALVTPVPKTDNALLHELGLVDRFVVQCAGNMGRAQGVENMYLLKNLGRYVVSQDAPMGCC